MPVGHNVTGERPFRFAQEQSPKDLGWLSEHFRIHENAELSRPLGEPATLLLPARGSRLGEH
jgi:hypothetical protein